MLTDRVVSGMRPTGRMHLGNYVGALANWVKLQDQYECYFFVADWHALTTDYEAPGDVQKNATEMVVDWLAAGVDPTQATLFVQSQAADFVSLPLAHIVGAGTGVLIGLALGPLARPVRVEAQRQEDILDRAQRGQEHIKHVVGLVAMCWYDR